MKGRCGKEDWESHEVWGIMRRYDCQWGDMIMSTSSKMACWRSVASQASFPRSLIPKRYVVSLLDSSFTKVGGTTCYLLLGGDPEQTNLPRLALLTWMLESVRATSVKRKKKMEEGNKQISLVQCSLVMILGSADEILQFRLIYFNILVFVLASNLAN